MHPPSNPSHGFWLMTATVALALLLSACGNGSSRSSTTDLQGEGGIRIGETRTALEAANPKWTIANQDGPGVTYRDYHWSLSYGFTHSARYHHVTYDASGRVLAWVSNDSPTAVRE